MPPETDDPSVERFARVTPPSGHEARVRARSGPGAIDAAARERTPSGGIAWRWVGPRAASALVVVAAVWQSGQATRDVLLFPPAAAEEWGGKSVDVPVLPPRAYWEMSALDEFERLRATARRNPTRAATDSARTASTALDGDSVAATAYGPVPHDVPWAPLPPIRLDDITPEPLEVPAITGLEPLELESIHIDPIDIVPMDKE
jgi:hypothetical protein